MLIFIMPDTPVLVHDRKAGSRDSLEVLVIPYGILRRFEGSFFQSKPERFIFRLIFCESGAYVENNLNNEPGRKNQNKLFLKKIVKI
jgi:hypothetical protein